jgi:hypothetical protein
MNNFLAIWFVGCAAWLPWNGETVTASRNYQAGGTNYVAEFRYNNSGGMVPAVNGPTQVHYDAVADLFRFLDKGRLCIASNIPCQYTEKGCFEDSLDALFYQVEKMRKTKEIASPWNAVTNLTVTNIESVSWTNSMFFTTNAWKQNPNNVALSISDITPPTTIQNDSWPQLDYACTNLQIIADHEPFIYGTNKSGAWIIRFRTNRVESFFP